MKYFLSVLLFFQIATSQACEIDVIAFKGLQGHFDNRAFNLYVAKHQGCAYVFNWDETNKALALIQNNNRPYQLYGYSKGADSVRIVLEKTNRLPKFVITIGAWRSVDLDFRKYNIPFKNYFDASGLGQKSPGLFLSNVPHYQMQAAINDLIWKVN